MQEHISLNNLHRLYMLHSLAILHLALLWLEIMEYFSMVTILYISAIHLHESIFLAMVFLLPKNEV